MAFKIFYLAIIFGFIFGPVFFSIGRWLDISFFVASFFVLYWFIHRSYKFPPYIIYFFPLFVLFSCLALDASIAQNPTIGQYMSLLLKPVRIIVTVGGAFGVSLMMYKKYGEDAFIYILNFIFLSIVIHGLVMVMQFLSPNFKDWVYAIITTGEYRSSFEYTFRMGGLSGTTGGSVLSVVQSLGVIVSPFLVKNNPKYAMLYLLGAALCFFSVTLCGRSGVLAAVFFLPLAIILAEKNYVGVLKTCSKLAALVGVFIFSVGIVTFELSYDLFKTWERSFSFFMEFSEKGVWEDDTILYLSSTLFLPENLKTWLIGDSEVLINQGFGRTLESDVGYIRSFWSFGIIGFAIYILPLAGFLVLSLKNFRRDQLASILAVLLTVMFLFHAKEPIFYVRMFFPIIALLVACIVLRTKISKTLKQAA